MLRKREIAAATFVMPTTVARQRVRQVSRLKC
jgi:hypothetical protein